MIPLGSRVRDTVTGFLGVATQRVELLGSAPRIYVEALVNGENKGDWIDESRCSIVSAEVPA